MIELVIVVVIIGVLGAIAIPRLSRGSEAASVNAFVAEINTFASAIERYQLESGNTIADSVTGEFPSELSDYLHADSWSGSTPLGGQWDIEQEDSGLGLAVGVVFDRTVDDSRSLTQVDGIIDDGDLDTGAFRFIGTGRYYLVLEE